MRHKLSKICPSCFHYTFYTQAFSDNRKKCSRCFYEETIEEFEERLSLEEKKDLEKTLDE